MSSRSSMEKYDPPWQYSLVVPSAVRLLLSCSVRTWTLIWLLCPQSRVLLCPQSRVLLVPSICYYPESVRIVHPIVLLCIQHGRQRLLNFRHRTLRIRPDSSCGGYSRGFVRPHCRLVVSLHLGQCISRQSPSAASYINQLQTYW